MRLGKKPFENIVGNGEIACTSNFSFSHVFDYIEERNYHYCNISFVVCKCFQFGLVQNFILWDWVKYQIDKNSLPNNKILDVSKLKASADEKTNVTEKLRFALGKVENIVGKREKAGHQHFLLFSQCFQKATF